MRKNVIAQSAHLVKRRLHKVWWGVVVESQALAVDGGWRQALQVLTHLIGLLNILFRWNGFARIQEAVMDQTQVWLWECFGTQLYH